MNGDDCKGCENYRNRTFDYCVFSRGEGIVQSICTDLFERCPWPSKRKEKEETRFERFLKAIHLSTFSAELIQDNRFYRALVEAGYEPKEK